MNFSVYSADRATHLRIVVTALVASVAIVAFASSAQIRSHHLLTEYVRSSDHGDAMSAPASDERSNNSPVRVAIR